MAPQVWIEFGVYDLAYVRLGRIEELDDFTYGAGISAGGILKLIKSKKSHTKPEGFRGRLWESFDIKYDIARISDFRDEIITYYKISLSF